MITLERRMDIATRNAAKFAHAIGVEVGLGKEGATEETAADALECLVSASIMFLTGTLCGFETKEMREQVLAYIAENTRTMAAQKDVLLNAKANIIIKEGSK